MIHKVFPVGLLQCNCSLLGDEVSGDAMVIDPGDNIQTILNLAKQQNLYIKQIVVTHAHIDHIAGAQELKQITGAPIFYNQLDLPLVHMMDIQAGWLGVPMPSVTPPDDSLADNQILKLSTIQGSVLHTPGHTEGSICLHFADQKLLIAGDTLFAGSVGRTDLPGGNSKALLRSIRNRLLTLPDDTIIIPGHGESTLIGTEKELNPFLQNL